jgi:hypothetical protein
MIKAEIIHESFVFISKDLLIEQKFLMDTGVGIGILYEMLFLNINTFYINRII